MEPATHPVRTAAGRVAGGLVAIVIGFMILTWLAPRQTGVVALGQIILPHLVLATLIAASVLAIALRTRAVTLAFVVLLALTVGRFGSDWVSLPAGSPAGQRVALMSWNMEHGSRPADAAAGPILAHPADVVALQELTPDVAAALDADGGIRTRYPYRILVPDEGAFGLGILSTYPIGDHAILADPVALAVTLDLGSDRRLRLTDTHPMHADIGTSGGLPTGYDARARDGELATIGTRVGALLETGDPVVVMGDFNTTPTEPGYALLTRALRDVHVEVGQGPGWTWRPSRFEPYGVGVLRIDMVLVGPRVEAVSSKVDCGYIGDHCILLSDVSVP